MNLTSHDIDHQQFMHQIENCELNPRNFDHIGHLRLAWIYLNQHQLETAVQKTCKTIKTYAESLGEMEKFHLTLTDATVRIMSQRILKAEGFEVFLMRNQDLVQDLIGSLLRHYSSKVLFSCEAKKVRLSPDLKPL